MRLIGTTFVCFQAIRGCGLSGGALGLPLRAGVDAVGQQRAGLCALLTRPAQAYVGERTQRQVGTGLGAGPVVAQPPQLGAVRHASSSRPPPSCSAYMDARGFAFWTSDGVSGLVSLGMAAPG